MHFLVLRDFLKLYYAQCTQQGRQKPFNYLVGSLKSSHIAMLTSLTS